MAKLTLRPENAVPSLSSAIIPIAVAKGEPKAEE